MKKTLLCTALLGLFCSSVYADNKMLPPPPVTPTAPSAIAPAPPAPPVKESSMPAAKPAQVIDCQYRIPAETTTIDQSLISTWSEKAAVQSFDFNAASLDDQLAKLKLCFTDQGWQSFNDALQKSGNLNAIKSQHLTVSSQRDGELKINPVKENQWKITIPLQVVYQNDKEKITQLLAVDLLVGRKVSGDLGIMQIIASPRVAGSESTSFTSPAASHDQAKNPPPADNDDAAPHTDQLPPPAEE